MLPPRKIMLDGFQKHLFVDYNDFCKRHDLSPSVEGLITFMIDKDFLQSLDLFQAVPVATRTKQLLLQEPT